MSHKIIENITWQSLSPVELETGTLAGSVNSKYDRVRVDLGGVEINACLKKFSLSLEGYTYVDLNVLDVLGFAGEKVNIRKHIPIHDVQVDGIIGTDSLPVIFKSNWLVDPILNIVVGNSIFGHFVFGSFKTGKISTSPELNIQASTSLVTSCKSKNFQLSLELLINNFFEIDKTPYEQTHLTLNESNAEKLFLKDIKFENNAYHISPLFNPLIPKEDLNQYMNSYKVAMAHYRKLALRLKRAPQTMQNLYHETFEGHIERGEFKLLTEEELNDDEGNFVTPVLVYKPERSKTKLRICWNLSLKNKFGKSINQAVLPGMNLIKNLLNHLMNLRQNRYFLTSSHSITDTNYQTINFDFIMNRNDTEISDILKGFDKEDVLNTLQELNNTKSVSYNAQYLKNKMTLNEIKKKKENAYSVSLSFVATVLMIVILTLLTCCIRKKMLSNCTNAKNKRSYTSKYVKHGHIELNGPEHTNSTVNSAISFPDELDDDDK